MGALDEPTLGERFYGPIPVERIRIDEDLTLISLDLGRPNEVWRCPLKVRYEHVSGKTYYEDLEMRASSLDGMIFTYGSGHSGAQKVLEQQTRFGGAIRTHWNQIYYPLQDSYMKVHRKKSFLKFMADLDEKTIAKRIEDREKLRSLISLCGLTQAEAATVLNLSHDTVRQRLTGHRPSPDASAEIATLIRIWRRILRGDVKDLPAGARRQSEILAFAKHVRLND